MSDNAAATTATLIEDDATEPDERLAYRGVFQRMLVRPEIGAAIGALTIWAFFWAVSVPFGKAGGAASILDVASSPLGIMAVAVAMLMIGGEFDLSSGAATGALGIVAILMVRDVVGGAGGWGLSLWLAIPLSLIAALGLGWVNGTVVERTGLPSFIVTLATFFVLRGAKLGYSKQIVEQIQVGKLDDLLLAADGERLETLLQLSEIDGAERTAMLRDLGISPIEPVEGLELGNGSFETLINAVHTAAANNDERALEELAALSRPFLEANDKGYEFLNNVFAYDWLRNDHIWDWRDPVYLVSILVGLSLLALAVYELHFRRSDGRGGASFATLLPGAAIAVLGIWRLHATDSVTGNVIGAALLGVAMLVGFIGWSLPRYKRRSSQTGAAPAQDGARAWVTPFAIGVISALGAVIIARWLDANDNTDIIVKWNLNGTIMLAIALAIGLLFGVLSGRFGAGAADALIGGSSGPVQRVLSSLIGTAGQRARTMAILGFMLAILFLDQATVQGARAVFFLLLGGAAAVFLLAGVRRARRTNHGLGSGLLFLTAAGVAAMAFFVRSESGTHKFRTEAFSTMLAIAGLMAVWALATALFEERSNPDPAADRFGRLLAVAGTAAVTLGIVVRLLAVTEAELALGIPPTRFSVRILWFIAFTAIATWVLGRTRFGSWTFAVGGNKEAARQIGVPAARTKTQLFMVVSFAAWLVGLLLAFRLNTIQASTGDGEEFEYIIAAVVGGNALTGGRGSTLGAAIGAFIMAMAVQGIPSSRWNSDWRFVFVGTILLLAVIANNFIRTQAEASR